MKTDPDDTKRFAGAFAALGHEARLEIMRMLLWAHPAGLVASELQQEVEIPASTLTHHLDALRHEGLITQRREGRYLRYMVVPDSLEKLLGFLVAECCVRNEVVSMSVIRKAGASGSTRQGRKPE